MRHRRICRYFRDYGYWKFSLCSHAHIEFVYKQELDMQKSEVNHLSQFVNNTVDEIIDLKIMVSNIKATNSNAFSESSQDHRDNTIVPRLK